MMPPTGSPLNQTPSLAIGILAGARPSKSNFSTSFHLPNKVFINIHMHCLLERVLHQAAQTVNKPSIYILMTESDDAYFTQHCLKASTPAYQRISPGRSAIQTILAAHQAIPPSDALILISGDHPLITSAIINSFYTQAHQSAFDFAMAVVPKETIKTHYPNVQRTFIPFKDGSVSGGNLFYIRRNKVPKTLHQKQSNFLETLEKYRKTPILALSLISFKTWALLGLNQLTRKALEVKLSQALGFSVGSIVIETPECAIDIDTLKDLRLAEEILLKRDAPKNRI
ncbi:MAG: nucleotidyltransferase family protein [Cyanobacteria bacterium]|nr:nucleotidyltransferase family protein [Cyanobacteriota bacterium]